ncbi:MAG TPA: CoA transferase [Burkholderiales bacterium]|nr:CoA transferase [Burkholderiales bacterium]
MPQAALREVLAAAGLQGEVEFFGDDPVLPIRYRVGAAGAAALGALGLGAAKLLSEPQRVSVNVRAAAVSLRSALYLRINGEPPPPVWDPMSGFYPVGDGWVSIHCNFPNHRDAALQVLGTEPDRAKAEEASRTWTGEALEDAIHAVGGCAGYVRSEEQWLQHPQAQAVASQPLLEIVQIGDAPPYTPPTRARPLLGVRVLDLTRVLAGPTCAKSLAAFGADVLKLSAAHLPDSGVVELDTGIGKRSARIDLRTQPQVERLRKLVAKADVFSQSYRPGALARRGFSPEDLAALRPGIVCASLSAWGESGPWRARRGFDSIVQAVSGIAQANGDGAKPKLLPVSAIDYVSGYLMAFGVCVALARRRREGGSWLVRVALARVGKFIVDQGVVPESAWRGLPDELPPEELEPLLGQMRSPDGRIRFLKPAVELSETPAFWSRPPVKLGYHPPVWTSG